MKLTSDAYVFAVTASPQGGVDITLTHTADGREKRFYVATGGVEAMTYHMNSLTDVCCADWFKGRRQ